MSEENKQMDNFFDSNTESEQQVVNISGQDAETELQQAELERQYAEAMKQKEELKRQKEELDRQLEELKRQSDEMKNYIAELTDFQQKSMIPVSESEERIGRWTAEKMDFQIALTSIDKSSAIKSLDDLKRVTGPLTRRIGKSAQTMLQKNSRFIDDKPRFSRDIMLDFVRSQFEVEENAVFLAADTDFLNAQEKIVYKIAISRKRITKKTENWEEVLLKSGWDLAVSLKKYQEDNKNLGVRLMESINRFCTEISVLENILKDAPEPTAKWIKKNLIDSIPDTQKMVKKMIGGASPDVKSILDPVAVNAIRDAYEKIKKQTK